jgi:hypothetical protein
MNEHVLKYKLEALSLINHRRIRRGNGFAEVTNNQILTRGWEISMNSESIYSKKKLLVKPALQSDYQVLSIADEPAKIFILTE